MDDFRVCPVDWENYDDKDHTPRLFPACNLAFSRKKLT